MNLAVHVQEIIFKVDSDVNYKKWRKHHHS
jgi:hypothetical protein